MEDQQRDYRPAFAVAAAFLVALLCGFWLGKAHEREAMFSEAFDRGLAYRLPVTHEWRWITDARSRQPSP